MQNAQIPFNQVILYITVINVILGFLFGMFPLLSGIKMNNRKYGIYGFIGAIIGGAILGVFLSFPTALVFTWLIIKKTVTGDAIAVNENPVEIQTANIENQ